MRCYFNLVSSHDAITDDEGLDVADVEEARTFAREAVTEMFQEGVAEIARWRGWEMRRKMPPGPSCSRLALIPRSWRPKSSLRPSRRRMGPTVATRQLDITGMWPVGTTDCV